MIQKQLLDETIKNKNILYWLKYLKYQHSNSWIITTNVFMD